MTSHPKSLAERITAATLSVVCSALTVATLASTPVEARHYRHHGHFSHSSHRYFGRAAYRQSFRASVHAMRHHHHLPVEAKGGIAAMVVDANSGRTLYAAHENELRHPASVTKVMTLYLLFEQMHRGRFNLATPIEISAHAAAQPPTKIGLRPGSTISLDNAIKAMVTESANDIAVAVAEAVGGSESAFAAMMTRKARALGMSQTVYVNASGLPDDRQITTAHDLVILGRAIQERYPDEYAYFSTQNFAFGGRLHHNHNHLLGQIDGVDGIKTGYTRASGFNLLASVRRDGRHIVSVVMGGRSSVSRDRIMTSLIEEHIAEASADGRSVPMIAENDVPEPTVAVAQVQTQPPVEQVAAAEAAAPRPQPVPIAAISPIAEAVPQPGVETASLAPRPQPAFVSSNGHTPEDETASIQQGGRRAALDGSTAIHPPAETLAYAAEESRGAVRWAAGPARRGRGSDRHSSRSEALSTPSRRENGSKIVTRTDTPRLSARVERGEKQRETSASERTEVSRDTSADDSHAKAGWVIQIGATADLQKANSLLARARPQLLASARPFTEKVRRGERTLYRARFAGLEPLQAEAACKALKRQGFPCFTVKN